MYDLAIVGAGPAGATLARLVGADYRVLCIDKRTAGGSSGGFSTGKCCGGLLAPDAQKMLSRLGLGLPKDVLVGPQLFVVKAIDIPHRLERSYQRHYINISRQKFDSWLLSMVPQKVDLRTSCRMDLYTHAADGFQVTLREGRRTYVERARIVVGADGAASRVRRLAAPKGLFLRRYLAVQEWVEGGNRPLPYFTSLFDPEITDFYAWTIPKEDSLLIGGAFPPEQEPLEKFELFKKKLGDYGFRFGKTVRREGAVLLRPMNPRQLFPGGQGVALIGEAAGWISPSSAEGLSYALKSALLLAESLRPGPEDFEKRYRERTRPLRRTLFLKAIKSHFLFNPFLRMAVMRSGLQSMEISQG
jgi:geranylgeranyl diphosphate/geranylgeranyl-bacteriochlorophyllide a reductase